jgi:ankyrin repeat protein
MMDRMTRLTLLELAAEGRHESVLKILFEGGADIEKENGEGETQLTWTAENGWDHNMAYLAVNKSYFVDGSYQAAS